MIKNVRRITYQEFLDLQKKDQIYEGLMVFELFRENFEESLAISHIRMDYFGALLITCGEIKMQINFKEYVFSKATIIFLSPTVVFQIISFSDDVQVLTLHTSFELFQQIGVPFYKTYSMEKLGNQSDVYLHLDQAEVERFVVYMRNLKAQNLMHGRSSLNKEIIKLTILLLFYEITAIITDNLTAASPGFENKNRLVMEFLNLVSKHFRSVRSIQFYADKMYISRKHLSRVIKEVMGKGPKAILDEIVLAEAVILLNVSSMTIKDVMGELNFSDFGTFSRFFKSYLGKSPLMYRNDIASRF